jgi:hypothetical protein
MLSIDKKELPQVSAFLYNKIINTGIVKHTNIL